MQSNARPTLVSHAGAGAPGGTAPSATKDLPIQNEAELGCLSTGALLRNVVLELGTALFRVVSERCSPAMATTGALLSASFVVLMLCLLMDAATVAHCQERDATFIVANLINEDLDLSPKLLVTCGRAAPASFELTILLPAGFLVDRQFRPDSSARTTWYCKFLWTGRTLKAQDFIVWADPLTILPHMPFPRNIATSWQATVQGLLFQTPSTSILIYPWRNHR